MLRRMDFLAGLIVGFALGGFACWHAGFDRAKERTNREWIIETAKWPKPGA